ncbi:unnamed protein product [Gadus morhua 'NCC']
MATCIPFQTQLTSIMEVLVKTAVSEISKLVDDKCGSLHIEISRTQSENEILKRKLLVMENQKAQMHRGFESYIDSGTDAGSSCPHPAGNIKFANADQDAAAFAIKEETPDEAVWRRRSSDSIGHTMQYSNTSAEAHLLDEPGQLSNAEFTNEGTPNHFAVSHNPGLRGEEAKDLQLTIKMEKEEGHSASGRDRCQHGTGKQNPLPGDFSLDDRENQLWSSIIEGNDIDAGFLDFSSVVEEYSSAFPNHPDTHAFPGGHCKAGAGPPSAPKPPCKSPYGGEYQKDAPPPAAAAAAAFQSSRGPPDAHAAPPPGDHAAFPPRIPGLAHPAHEPSERDADSDRTAFSPDGFPPPPPPPPAPPAPPAPAPLRRRRAPPQGGVGVGGRGGDAGLHLLAVRQGLRPAAPVQAAPAEPQAAARLLVRRVRQELPVLVAPQHPPPHAHGREAVRLRPVRQALHAAEQPARAPAHAQRRATLQLHAVRQDLHPAAPPQEAPDHPRLQLSARAHTHTHTHAHAHTRIHTHAHTLTLMHAHSYQDRNEMVEWSGGGGGGLRRPQRYDREARLLTCSSVP